MANVKSVLSNIRVLRIEKRLSQTDIADKLQVSQNAYSKIELGYTQITLEVLLQVSDILEVDVHDLLTIKKQKPLK